MNVYLEASLSPTEAWTYPDEPIKTNIINHGKSSGHKPAPIEKIFIGKKLKKNDEVFRFEHDLDQITLLLSFF